MTWLRAGIALVLISAVVVHIHAVDADIDAGFPVWTNGPCSPTSGTDTLVATCDSTDAETFAATEVTTLFDTGSSESGNALRWEQLEWRGTITGGSGSAGWVVKVNGRIRAKTWAVNYTAGSGTFTATAIGKIHFESTIAGDPHTKEVTANATITPASHADKEVYGRVSENTGTAPIPNQYARINWTHTGSTVGFKLLVNANSSIETTRAEVTLHAKVYFQEDTDDDVVGTAQAFDGGWSETFNID